MSQRPWPSRGLQSGEVMLCLLKPHLFLLGCWGERTGRAGLLTCSGLLCRPCLNGPELQHPSVPLSLHPALCPTVSRPRVYKLERRAQSVYLQAPCGCVKTSRDGALLLACEASGCACVFLTLLHHTCLSEFPCSFLFHQRAVALAGPILPLFASLWAARLAPEFLFVMLLEPSLRSGWVFTPPSGL